MIVSNERELAALAVMLGARSVHGWSTSEASIIDEVPSVSDDTVSKTLQEIDGGGDPLGDMFCRIRTSESRRQDGAIYTPFPIVNSMLDWAADVGIPDRVVDPGSGSGRFLLEAGRRFPNARLVAIESDPLAALISRANLAVAGMAHRSEVRVENFLKSDISSPVGATLFVGNPPYVRHHNIPLESKSWLKARAAAMGLQASTLAGLHVYFFLMIASRARVGDYGALITASEWLDVNYGQLVRDLFLDRLGGKSVHIIDQLAEPFPGTASTGAITTFKINGRPRSAKFTRVKRLTDLGSLSAGHSVSRDKLAVEPRWTYFTKRRRTVPEDYVELGELCRVHRGQVTGANRVWVEGIHSQGLPDDVLYPTVTKAKELFDAGLVLSDGLYLKRVIDLPEDLSELRGDALAAVRRFLLQAELMGAKDSYVAKNRRAWWSVSLRDPAPVLATYMARRSPTFVLNAANARHINVAHGLYPRDDIDAEVLSALVSYLRTASPDGGRVYAGGLTKFEPREMERIPVPDLKTLKEMST